MVNHSEVERDHVAIVDPSRMEFSLYAFLKMYVYERILHLLPQLERMNKPLADGVPPAFSARRIHRAMATRTTSSSAKRAGFTDFYDISPYFLRNRLQGLNHGTALQEKGRGVRNSVTYEWKEPVDRPTLDSYRKLRDLVGGATELALDVFRIVDAFGTQPFHRNDFVDLFRHKRNQYVKRRWYKISTRTPSGSVQFTTFLLDRLQAMLDDGAVEAAGRDMFCVSEKGENVYDWMELFLYSVRLGDPPKPKAPGPRSEGRRQPRRGDASPPPVPRQTPRDVPPSII